MHLPASLKSCRIHLSPAIRSSLCRSTPQPRTTCRGFACSAFARDRSKKNSKRCSSKANEELSKIATGHRGRNGADRHQIRRGDVRVGSWHKVAALQPAAREQEPRDLCVPKI